MSANKNARNRCGFWRFAGKRYKLSAWRTEVRDGRPSDHIARVFELFFLDIPGFSGFLLLSYPVCGP